jgi:hypothetical protein
MWGRLSGMWGEMYNPISWEDASWDHIDKGIYQRDPGEAGL